jgi:DNA-directed RNA polymerase specialized sigma24 family protein
MKEDRLHAELAKQDWKDIHARVMKYALNRGATYADAEDFTQRAIERVFAFDSEWDPENHPVLAMYLMGLVKTMLRDERRRVRRIAYHDHHADEDDEGFAEHEDPRAISGATVEENDLYVRRLALLRARLEKRDDPDAIRVLELWVDEGVELPTEIGEATGWPSARVSRARDRMQRAALEVARELEEDEKVR